MSKYHPTTTIVLLFLTAASLATAQLPEMKERDPTSVSIDKSKPLRFASPLQSFTIFRKTNGGGEDGTTTTADTKTPTMTTPREEFLPKFRAGLQAELRAKDAIAKERVIREDEEFSGDYVGGKDWDKKSEESDRLRFEREEARVERAFEGAVRRFSLSRERQLQQQQEESLREEKKKKEAGYQFVGLINPPSEEKKVTWYARKRPANSKWNVRLVHVNRDAVLRDLFVKGKIDVYGEYVNAGPSSLKTVEVDTESTSEVAVATPSLPDKPIIERKYSVKERSWRTLWNFSPKHFFTDSSGAFWRERRLKPGLYTDGRIVYEASYRYSDGKNGMKPISGLEALLRSEAIREDVKVDLLKRLKGDSPDVVIEK